MKAGPRFLRRREVMAIHADQIRRFGGSQGTADHQLLEAALVIPRAMACEGILGNSDLHELAATYLYHMVLTPPFADGNRRTGTVAALVFMHLNGHACHAPQDELIGLVQAIAWGTCSRTEVAAFLRRWDQPSDDDILMN